MNGAVGIFAIAAVYLQLNHADILKDLRKEDGLLESATAIFYFTASGLFLEACRHYRFRNPWCWGYAIMFFMVAAEEISWGQRLLGFATPAALQQINVQNEFNVHNIVGIHENVRLAGLIVILVICFILPVTNASIPEARVFYQRLKLPVCPIHAMGVVIIAVTFMAYPRWILGRIIPNLDEVGEFLLSVGLLAFAAAEYSCVRGRLNRAKGAAAVG
ncbi:MAG: hypothetical protein KJ749_15705 [Planctomycetes bacterium]|nr:hypothetical protein [Planctomycetota bacterium]